MRGTAAISQAGTAANFSSELEAFGWWFLSGRFDDQWAVVQLVKTLELCGSTRPDHLVAERLADLAIGMPAEAVHCLHLLVDGDKKGWTIIGVKKPARTILSIALKSGNGPARERAIEVVNRLAARGHLEFKNLLGE